MIFATPFTPSHASALWAVIQPLIGVVVGIMLGTYLTRSWDRRKWINDNRKEECRDLLVAFNKTADAYYAEHEKRGLPDSMKITYQHEAYLEYRRSLVVIQSCIFISKELREKKIFALWGDAIGNFLSTKDADHLMTKLNLLKEMITEIAWET